MKYTKHFNVKATPQSEAIPGKNMVANSAGGFAFAVDDWKRLERFLILGSEGGTYYIGEKKLTKDNAEAVIRCIGRDGIRAVNTIVAVSLHGRAPKNDPALFALALCASLGDADTRACALGHLGDVARTGTHLFHFAQYVNDLRGWGRGLREAVARWYERDDIDYQVAKYQQRDGWSHADLIRLSHPTPNPDNQSTLIYTLDGMGGYAGNAKRGKAAREPLCTDFLPMYLAGMEIAKSNKEDRVSVINDYCLEREMVPTEWLDDPDVWEALLANMKPEAILRNLGKMSNVGLIQPNSLASKTISELFTNQEAILKSRLHPLKILVGMKVYEQGHGEKGKLIWAPDRRIVDALDEAFYLAFGNVTPTGKNIMLALDISGSMGMAQISGMPLTAREASCALALVTARVEPNYQIATFDTAFSYLDITPRMRLDDVIRKTSALHMGGTDCALPMLHALEKGHRYDAFVVYTDSETWAGRVHPVQALQEYRGKMGIPAKLIVVGMTATEFTIADSDDAGMMDIVGFSTDTPEVMSNFISE